VEEERSKDPPRWKILENVVAAIEASLNGVPGANIIPNAGVPDRVSGTRRQVDVFIEVPTGARQIRVGIEVRHEKARVDLPEAEGLIAKLKKLDIDVGCIVSSSGFTASVEEAAAREGVQLKTVREIETPEWWRVPSLRVQRRHTEVFDIGAFFDESDRAAYENANLSSPALVKIRHADGSVESFVDYVAAQCSRAIVSDPRFAMLKHEDVVTVTIDFKDVRAGARLATSTGVLPLPLSLHVKCKVFLSDEDVPLVAYQQGDNLNAFTGVSTDLGKQLTVIAITQPDGSKRIMGLAAGDAEPQKAKIDARRNEGS